jgi:hypothetical protein
MTDPINNQTFSEDGTLTVMPSYYLPKGGSKSKIPPKVILLIVGGVILLLLITVTVLLVMRSGKDQQQLAQAPLVVDSAPEQNTSEPVVTEEEEPEEEVIEEEPEEEVILAPQSLVPPVIIEGLLPGEDTDQDGLSDEEESLFSTSAAAPDTDQDGFLDGPEIINLYDPATPGALLEVSPQIKIARNSTRGYQLLIPQSFTFQSLDAAGAVVRIVVPGNAELFTIEMIPNDDRMTPVQWYQAQDSGADLSQFNNFSNEAGWTGVQSQDGRIVIATFGDDEPGAKAFIFLMHYQPATDLTLRYSTVWQMMLQSLTILEDKLDVAPTVAPPPASSPTTTIAPIPDIATTTIPEPGPIDPAAPLN